MPVHQPLDRCRIRLRAVFALAALAAPCALLVGCPSALENPEIFRAALDAGGCPDIPNLLATTCATSACHSAAALSGNLDLESADVLGRLSDQSASGGSGLLIDTLHPAMSVLYTKLLDPPPFGGRMPLGGQSLSADTAQCVLTWLE
jgi:hypothetical protein